MQQFLQRLTNTYLPQRTEDPLSYTTSLDRMQQYAKALYLFITGTNPVGGYTRMI